MNGGAGEGDRHLGAGDVAQPQRLGGRQRAGLATDLVVVGQRPEFHPVGLGALRERLGREGAVGDDGMAVEVGVEHMGHRFILGFPE
ncbi:hypothetical protein D9M69_622430 [compost metagenome]